MDDASSVDASKVDASKVDDATGEDGPLKILKYGQSDRLTKSVSGGLV